MTINQHYLTLSVLLTLLVPTAPCAAATITWKPNRAGDWNDGGHWEGGRVPMAGDDVVIIAPGAKVTLRGSTPKLRSLTLGGVLTFSQWDTVLTTGTLTVKSGGWITHEGPFKQKAQAARVVIH